jgi:hypothetical protein
MPELVAVQPWKKSWKERDRKLKRTRAPRVPAKPVLCLMSISPHGMRRDPIVASIQRLAQPIIIGEDFVE